MEISHNSNFFSKFDHVNHSNSPYTPFTGYTLPPPPSPQLPLPLFKPHLFGFRDALAV